MSDKLTAINAGKKQTDILIDTDGVNLTISTPTETLTITVKDLERIINASKPKAKKEDKANA